ASLFPDDAAESVRLVDEHTKKSPPRDAVPTVMLGPTPEPPSITIEPVPKRRWWLALLLLLLLPCGGYGIWRFALQPAAVPRDAAIDASRDAAVDAKRDAQIDATPDALVDALTDAHALARP